MDLYTRNISFESWEGDGGRLAIRGILKDTRLGEDLRHIEIRAEIDLLDGSIHSLEGEMPRITYGDECRNSLSTLERLVGERIVPGFSDLVRNVVGSSEGCAHLAVLVTNLGHASVQARGALVASRFADRNEALDEVRRHALDLGILGGCYAWREGGPLMRALREQMGGEDPPPPG